MATFRMKNTSTISAPSTPHTTFSSARGHVETYQRYLSDTHGIALPEPGAPAKKGKKKQEAK